MGRSELVQEGHEITKEEMQQLILLMGTITVISFILVITLSSIIIVFIWFSQKELNRRCYCSNLKTTSTKGKTIQHEKDITRDYEKNYISENEIRGNNLKTNVESVEKFQVNHGLYKNLIVNPLPAVQPYLQVSVPEHNLLPAVNKSSGPTVNCIYGVEDELGKIESDEEDKTVAEPIYSEITTKVTEVNDKKSKIDNHDADREVPFYRSPNKKEIDYWQISTREVAQFRPCTETFINRDKIC